MTSFAATHGDSLPVRLTRTIFGIGDVVRAAAHCDRHVQAAGAERQHADAAAGRRMAVRTDQGLAR